jgi:hypothetical protein
MWSSARPSGLTELRSAQGDSVDVGSSRLSGTSFYMMNSDQLCGHPVPRRTDSTSGLRWWLQFGSNTVQPLLLARAFLSSCVVLVMVSMTRSRRSPVALIRSPLVGVDSLPLLQLQVGTSPPVQRLAHRSLATSSSPSYRQGKLTERLYLGNRIY